jgi:RNA polymerase-binding protein DksA
MATARKPTKSNKVSKNRTVKRPTVSTNGKLRSGKPKTASKRRTATKTHKAAAAKASTNGKSASKQAPPVLNQKEMLRQERAQVESELANLRAEMQEAPELTGDEVDLNVYEREKTLGLVAAYERRLEEIDLTLKVAAQGKYGICERCGKPIDPERLKIFPETRLCVNCKNIVEREQRRLRMG